ncbi:MAG: hypothetical protein ACYCYM_05750 [Saccharofermentanales bacterium]
MISYEDRNIIRELAKKVSDIADLPVMAERRELWKKHNRLEHVRPMLLVFPEGSWHEIIPASMLKCKDDAAREIEWKLLARIYRHEIIGDDFVVEKDWNVQKIIRDTGWGIEPAQSVSHNDSGSIWGFDSTIGHSPKVWDKNFKFNNQAWGSEPVLKDPADLKKIRFPEVIYDERESLANYETAQQLVGDILNVKLVGKVYIQFALMEFYCLLRGMEQVMYDMYEEPEMIHEAMSLLEEGNRGLMNQYYDMNLLSLNNDGTYHSSGGIGYSTELPRPGYDSSHVRLCDMWGSSESQEMTIVSPGMHYEFSMQYEKRLLQPFGLSGYGCCDALDDKLDDVMTIPNLRRISISPWANVDKCADKLKDRYIFSWKPNPTYIAAEFNPERIREYVGHTLDCTKNCVTEILMKDTHTCQNHPERFAEWVRIVRQLIDQK